MPSRRDFLTTLGIAGFAAAVHNVDRVTKIVVPEKHLWTFEERLLPEVWARESLRILNERSVVASLVHRDFVKEMRPKGERIMVSRGIHPVFSRTYQRRAPSGTAEAYAQAIDRIARTI